MIFIKCFFPGNNYLLRKVKIKQDKKTIALIGHGETVQLDDSLKGEVLEFKLDYHKAKIQVPESKEDIFIVLYLEFRKNFPYYYTDIMFKNSLRSKLVSKEDFEKFSSSFYEIDQGSPIKFNLAKIFVIAVSIAISLEFIIYSFILQNANKNDTGFLLIIGIATLIGSLNIIVNRKKINEMQFKIRSIAFVIIGLLMLFFYDIHPEIKAATLTLLAVTTFLAVKESAGSVQK